MELTLDDLAKSQKMYFFVIPAKAGIQFVFRYNWGSGCPREFIPWIPAFAGMTHGAGMTLKSDAVVLISRSIFRVNG